MCLSRNTPWMSDSLFLRGKLHKSCKRMSSLEMSFCQWQSAKSFLWQDCLEGHADWRLQSSHFPFVNIYIKRALSRKKRKVKSEIEISREQKQNQKWPGEEEEKKKPVDLHFHSLSPGKMISRENGRNGTVIAYKWSDQRFISPFFFLSRRK